VTVTEEPVRQRWILAAVSIALFCLQIDYFAMNLALPRMAIDLNSTATDLQWVISVYMLALGAFMAPAGRCISRPGGHRVVRPVLGAVRRSRHRVGLWHSGIGQRGRPADRWVAHRDGQLAVDILAERAA